MAAGECQTGNKNDHNVSFFKIDILIYGRKAPLQKPRIWEFCFPSTIKYSSENKTTQVCQVHGFCTGALCLKLYLCTGQHFHSFLALYSLACHRFCALSWVVT